MTDKNIGGLSDYIFLFDFIFKDSLLRNIFLIATTFFFCGGNAFAMYRSIPCALSYKNYRQYLIKTGATPIKCDGDTYYWDELCKNGWGKHRNHSIDEPYAAWNIKGLLSGAPPVRYIFPVRHPFSFHRVDKFSKGKFKNLLCVKAEYFWDDAP